MAVAPRLRAALAFLAWPLARAVLHRAAPHSGKPSAARTAEELVADLWSGLDVQGPGDHEVALASVRVQPGGPRPLGSASDDTARGKGVGKATASSEAVESEAGESEEPKKLLLLGPFDSGTNLLLRTLHLNYGKLLSEACDWKRHTVVELDEHGNCRLWKHGLRGKEDYSEGPKEIYRILRRQEIRPEDTVALLVVRSPLALMEAWRKAPYTMENCVSRDLSQWDSHCRTSAMAWDRFGHPQMFAKQDHNTTMEIYNRHWRLFRQLESDGVLNKTLVVTYEDMVISPGSVVNAVAEAVGWPRRESVDVLAAPSKGHGHVDGRQEALERLRKRDWLHWVKTWTGHLRRKVCGGFEMDLFRNVTDNNYSPQEPSRSYGADCKGFHD